MATVCVFRCMCYVCMCFLVIYVNVYRCVCIYIYIYIYIYINYSMNHMAIKREYAFRDSLAQRKALTILPHKFLSVFKMHQ